MNTRRVDLGSRAAWHKVGRKKGRKNEKGITRREETALECPTQSAQMRLTGSEKIQDEMVDWERRVTDVSSEALPIPAFLEIQLLVSKQKVNSLRLCEGGRFSGAGKTPCRGESSPTAPSRRGRRPV